jgi:hypothetical protein
MKSRNEILREHYSRLLQKVAAWGGLVALIIGLGMPSIANAAQLTERSLTLTSSAASAVTTYKFAFKPGTSTTVGAVKFELCTSPLENVSCTTPGGASQAAAASLTLGGQIAGFTLGTGTPPAPTAQTVWITNGTPQSLTAGTASTVQYSSVTNPNTTNQTFYARITTYAASNGTTEVDYGAVAVSTANQVTVSANVQESLTFCVYTGANCAAGGSTVNLGVGTDNVLSTSSPSGGVSKMDADTNATTGYAITYITTSPGGTGGTACAGSLSSSNDCITDFGGTAGTFAGSGSGAVSSPYNTVDNFAFQGGLTPRTVGSSSGPTLSNTYNVAYAAQAGSTTKPGSYSAVFTWVCTGTF